MSYQNAGTYNAGVFSSGKLSVPGSAPGVPTMDADGIASGGAFLVSELEKRDPLIRKPLSSFTYPRDIVIQTGGGWVDYASAMSVAYGITGGSGDSPVTAGGANGVPIVQASLDKGLYKAHVFAAALRVMFVDMQKSNYIGRSLDQLLGDGVRMSYDKHMDENGTLSNKTEQISAIADAFHAFASAKFRIKSALCGLVSVWCPAW